MYNIRSTTPMTPIDGHVDIDFTDRKGWTENMGATILPIMIGDDHCGPFVALSYVEPTNEQMPLSFAHAHASDNWRISVRGTTNMGRDAYEQGQFRFHDGGVPYASDNFAWGPDGGYGIIMFADRRGFAIRPVKAELAEQMMPAQEVAGRAMGIDVQDPCPGAPAIITTLGPTARAHLDGGFDTSEQWDEIAPGVRMAAGLAGEPTCGPVLVFVDCAAATEAVPVHSIGSETMVAPVSGSIDVAGVTMSQGDVRVEEADVDHPALVAGPDGAQVVIIFADRRELRSALDDGRMSGALGAALSPVLEDLQRQLPLADSCVLTSECPGPTPARRDRRISSANAGTLLALLVPPRDRTTASIDGDGAADLACLCGLRRLRAAITRVYEDGKCSYATASAIGATQWWRSSVQISIVGVGKPGSTKLPTEMPKKPGIRSVIQ